jgi:polyhydroxyalkanoate synthesis regulator phasin
MKIVRNSALACLFGLLSATAAFADDCSGRDHTAGTVLGAAGGAAIGGVATHNAGGAIAGAVVGGLAGNAIARSQDCNRDNYRTGYSQPYDGRGDRGAELNYYGPSYAVSADENDYWGVDSYEDFGSDYRHIAESIDRARERGSLNRYEARRFSQRLQQIQYRANTQQRRGRFNAQDIEYQLSQLRDDMRSARQNNREEQHSGNYNRR